MRKSNQDVPKPSPARLRCAIYTRKSTEKGLDQEFNSLDAQREAAQAFILSQRCEGWIALPEPYDDGGFTGANMDRPALARLLRAVERGELDCVVVYKVDRLSRSLLDFTRMLSVFEKHNVSFVAVTQQFNTSTSLGRLTLNILLSFAQFERELIGERTRDKMSAPDGLRVHQQGHLSAGVEECSSVSLRLCYADDLQLFRGTTKAFHRSVPGEGQISTRDCFFKARSGCTRTRSRSRRRV